MPLDLTALENELAHNGSVDDSAGILIDKLLADVEANKSNPTAVQSVVDRWRAQSDKLAASVAKGTPAEEPPSGETQA